MTKLIEKLPTPALVAMAGATLFTLIIIALALVGAATSDDPETRFVCLSEGVARVVDDAEKCFPAGGTTADLGQP
jgi:hypothetical protein